MLTGDRGQFSDDRQRVLDATDIVRLIGEQLTLKPKGREYVGLCPFHDDHAPSMTVVPHKQIYHCFSCGAGGNALGFVMNFHKMSFREALQHLAERGGITLSPPPQRSPRPGFGHSGGFSTDAPNPFEAYADADGGPTSRAQLMAASATATTFFRAILAHAEHGKAARAVIERRQIAPDMVERFQLGAAPDKWDGLLMTIQAKGLDPAPFRAAGLLKARESSSGLYDALRNRLVFPIHDQIGRVIAFGGRRLNDEDEPKYLNSSESAIFDKSSTVYGLHQAAQDIRKTGTAIITEGYMDTIACHQAGIGNAVATLGTALTPGHARILRRLCSTIVLLFDGDQAGQKAAQRAVEVFFAEPVDVRIATLSSVTDAKDPDELLKRDGGPALLKAAIDRAIDPLELLFSSARASVEGLGVSARSRAIEDFAARLVDLGLNRLDKVRYQLVVKNLAAVAGLDWDTIAQTLSQKRDRPRFRAQAERPDRADPGAPNLDPHRPLTAREHLLGCVMCEPSLTLSLSEAQWALLEPDSFEDPVTRAVARVLTDVLLDEGQPSLQSVLERCEDRAAQQHATRLASEIDRLTDGARDRLHKHWLDRLAAAQRAELPTTPDPAASGAAPAQSPIDRIKSLRVNRAGAREDRRLVPRPDS